MKSILKNKNLLILGGKGFLGFHLNVYLNYKLGLDNIQILSHNDFKNNKRKYEKYLLRSDIIFNTSGVNRSNKKGEIYNAHRQLLNYLIKILSNKKKRTVFYNFSSIQIIKKTEYGLSKRYLSAGLKKFSKKNSLFQFKNILLPNLFGEFSKPNYNSFISTFCYDLLKNKESYISGKSVELLYVVDAIKQSLKSNKNQERRIKGKIVKINQIYKILQKQNQSYTNRIIPKFRNSFEKKLFNTYRNIKFNYFSKFEKYDQFKDSRGILVEVFKNQNISHVFYSTTKKNKIRGNHFHMNKIERFTTIHGKTKILLKKLYETKWHTIELSKNNGRYLDIPTYYVHKLISNSNNNVISIFFSDEIYDRLKPDTYLYKES